MSKSNRGYTRRAFMVLGGTTVGAATLTGTAQAAGPHPKIHGAIAHLRRRMNVWSTPVTTSVDIRRTR